MINSGHVTDETVETAGPIVPRRGSPLGPNTKLNRRNTSGITAACRVTEASHACASSPES